MNSKIPSKALFLLVNFLENMVEAKSNAVIQPGEILSTRQASDISNISRPYLIKRLEEE